MRVFGTTKEDQILRTICAPGGDLKGVCRWPLTGRTISARNAGAMAITTSGCAGSGHRFLLFPTRKELELDCGNSLQQECEDGMAEDPHWSAISWQHSRSCSVRASARSMQSSRGEPHSAKASMTAANLQVHLTILSVVRLRFPLQFQRLVMTLGR